jgi:hypothetical protein
MKSGVANMLLSNYAKGGELIADSLPVKQLRLFQA